MPVDTEKYRKILKTLNLKQEQEDFIIAFVCNMMEEFVLAAFGKHPVQHAQQNKTSPKGISMVESEHQLTFNTSARKNKNGR